MADGDYAALVAKIKVDISDFERGMNNATAKARSSASEMESSFNKAKEALSEFGIVLGAGALIEFTKHSIDAGAELYTLSKNSGIAVESLSALSHVAKDNGTNIEAVAQGIKFLQRNVSEAMQGNKQAADSFKQIGLAAKDLVGKTDIDRLLLVANSVKDLGSASDKTKVLMDLLGRSGTELGGMMSQGAEGIKRAMDQAARLGEIVTEEEAKRMDEFNRKWTTFVDQCQRLAQMSFVGIADLITKAAGSLSASIDPMASRTIDQINTSIANLEERKQQLEKQAANQAKGGIMESLFGDPEQVKKNLAKVNDDLDYAYRMQKNMLATQGVTGPESKANKRLIPTGLTDEQKQQMEINKTIADYLTKQKEANEVVGAAKSQQAGLAAYYQLVNDLMSKGLTLQEAEIRIGPERKKQIEDLANAHAMLVEQQREARRAAEDMQRDISDGLTKLAFDFKSASQAAGDFFKTLASNIFKAKVSDPLSKSIMDALGGTSLFSTKPASTSSSGSGGFFSSVGSFLGFASGGDPPVGVPYWVGENGPELRIDKTPGTIIPNNKINTSGGSGQIIVTNVFQISTGVQQTVRAEVMNMMPEIQNRTTAAVAGAVQQGGSFAKVMGVRN